MSGPTSPSAPLRCLRARQVSKAALLVIRALRRRFVSLRLWLQVPHHICPPHRGATVEQARKSAAGQIAPRLKLYAESAAFGRRLLRVYDPRPDAIEPRRLVVCPDLLRGTCRKEPGGARRELAAGRSSEKHFQRDGNVEYAVLLSESASRTWRRLMGFKLIPLVMERRTFVDGELTEAAA